MSAVELRPHHLLDIVCEYEPGRRVEPAESGNAVHVITEVVDTGLGAALTLCMGADDICRPCRHLQDDGTCERVLTRFDPPQPMQEYNDRLDSALFEYLGLRPGTATTIRAFLELAAAKLPDIESLGTLDGDSRQRFAGLGEGLRKLGLLETPPSEP